MTFNLEGCLRLLAAVVIGTAGFVSSAPAREPAAQTIRHGSVTIKRDTWGTPHVYANTVHGLFYGYGYAVAQDRLFQMDMARRTFTGQVAEVLGEKYVTFDQSIRANYTPASLARQYDALRKDDKAVFEGYAAGFNAWVKEVGKHPDRLMPKQYNDLGFKPVAWTPMDVVMIFVGSMANRFSDFNTEIDNLGLLNALRAKHGEQKATQIFDQLKWINDPNAPTTIPKGPAERKVVGPLARADVDNHAQLAALVEPSRQAMLALTRLPRGPYGELLHMPPTEAESYLAALLARDGLTGMAGYPQASNMWIVGRDKAKDATAILFNGPQFGWFNPAYVYSVGLHGAGFNVVGNTPFAYPNLLFGHNGKIAWGSTAGFGDGVDIYQEKLNPDNPHEYLYNGKVLPMTRRTETIRVKGAAPVALDVYGTVHGLVVVIDKDKGVAYSKKRTWDGHELESMLGWLHQMQAQNYDQWIRQAARMAITINWYYADDQGNIGYAYTGKFPRRRSNHDPRLPAIGTGEMEWEAVLPFSTNPQMLNPKQGWLANWNNKPAPGYPSPDMLWLSWAETDRVDYLMDRLEARDKFTAEELAQINEGASYVDVNARYFIPFLKEAVAALPADDARRQAVALFDGWDQQASDRTGDGKYDHPAATIMRTWLPAMLKRTLSDAVPESYFKYYASAGYPVAGVPVTGSVNIQPGTKVLYQALRGKHAGIAQHYDFFNGKDPLEVVREALADSVAQLKQQYGDDMREWLTPVAEHVYLSNNFLGIPQAGGDEVLKNPVMMNRGTENDLIAFTSNGVQDCEVTPPGQSGFVSADGTRARHYHDQLEMYGRFGCKPAWLDPRDVDRNLESKTVLRY
jgi:penicillin amidase